MCAFLVAWSSPVPAIVLSLSNWDSGRLPAGWQIKVVHGKPQFGEYRDGNISTLHLRSDKASFSLERAVEVDPARTPYMSWRWMVTALPAGGDFRHAWTDDQAAQVLVVFNDRHVLSYIWDTSAPKGTMENAVSVPFVHVFAVVCQSGAAQVNQWVPESRNVKADFERAYGMAAPFIKGVRIQINSQHTGTVAESYVGDVAFRGTPL